MEGTNMGDGTQQNWFHDAGITAKGTHHSAKPQQYSLDFYLWKGSSSFA
jgi:hypothetical protein